MLCELGKTNSEKDRKTPELELQPPTGSLTTSKRIQLLQTTEGLVVPDYKWLRGVWACFWLGDIELIKKRVEG